MNRGEGRGWLDCRLQSSTASLGHRSAFRVGGPVNHIDRMHFSVAAAQLQRQFGLDAAGIGLLVNIFFWFDKSLQINAPSVAGMFLGAADSFVNAFLVAGVVLVTGIVFYVFVLGRIRPTASGSGPEALYAASSA